MEQRRSDPTFCPSPKMAMQAPAEQHAFVALLNPTHQGRHDALGVVDVDPNSSTYSQKFFLAFDSHMRGYQIRLEGGDTSSDSFCYP